MFGLLASTESSLVVTISGGMAARRWTPTSLEGSDGGIGAEIECVCVLEERARSNKTAILLTGVVRELIISDCEFSRGRPRLRRTLGALLGEQRNELWG